MNAPPFLLGIFFKNPPPFQAPAKDDWLVPNMVIFYFHASKEAGNCLKSIRMSQNCKISMDVAFMSPSIYKESKWHNYQKEIKKKGYYQSIYPFKTSPSLLGLAWQLSSASFVAFNASRRNSSRLPQ